MPLSANHRSALIIWLAAACLWALGHDPSWAGEGPPKKLALVPFIVPAESPEREWLSDGLSRVVALRLQAVASLKPVVVPRAALAGLEGLRGGFEGEDVAALLGRLRPQGFEVVVLGRFQQLETVLRLEVHVWMTQPPRHAGKALDQAPERDPDALGAKVAAFVASTLLGNVSETEARRVGERYTPSAEAFERFAKAVVLAETADDEEEIRAAVALLREALALDAKFAIAYRQLADLQLRWGQYAEAAEAYQGYLSTGRRTAQIYRALGNAYFAQGDAKRAVDAYRRGVQLDARDPQLSVDLGLAYAVLRDYENATKTFLRALEVKPDDALAFANLGVVYLLQGNFPAATASLRRAQELQPADATLAYNLGLALMLERAYDQARAQFERALQLRPRSPEAAYQLALIAERMDPAQAVEHWRRYLEVADGAAGEAAWQERARARLKALQPP
jgi:Flp pilus assembly protein TadD